MPFISPSIGVSASKARRVGIISALAACLACQWATGAEPPSVPTVCDVAAPAPFCQAVRGDRSEGWRSQSRSEVIAQHGMVATSQPLAAQAGLQVLMRGGNAID